MRALKLWPQRQAAAPASISFRGIFGSLNKRVLGNTLHRRRKLPVDQYFAPYVTLQLLDIREYARQQKYVRS
jgi:hypothetical protein